MADKGLVVTSTAPRTRLLVTQQFIVALRTLGDAVTHVVDMETDVGSPAAIVARTRVVVTVRFVLMARTVVDTVAADIDRETVVTIFWTLKVSIWTQAGLFVRFVVQASMYRNNTELPVAVKVHNNRRLGFILP